jgi:hypothetical protein
MLHRSGLLVLFDFFEAIEVHALSNGKSALRQIFASLVVFTIFRAEVFHRSSFRVAFAIWVGLTVALALSIFARLVNVLKAMRADVDPKTSKRLVNAGPIVLVVSMRVRVRLFHADLLWALR